MRRVGSLLVAVLIAASLAVVSAPNASADDILVPDIGVPEPMANCFADWDADIVRTGYTVGWSAWGKASCALPTWITVGVYGSCNSFSDPTSSDLCAFERHDTGVTSLKMAGGSGIYAPVKPYCGYILVEVHHGGVTDSFPFTKCV